MPKLFLPKNHWFALDPAPARECPYLPDREIALDLGVVLPDPEYFDHLMQSGHRRLGQIFYTPMCAGCRDCVPIRVSLADFRRSRSQRKLWRKVSAGYEVTVRPPVFEPEHFEVYRQHSMFVSEENSPGSPESYVQAFLSSQVDTHLIEYHYEGQFVGASILDEGALSVSSVYVFWDPALAHLSPGTFSALWEMHWALERGKRFYYLGYYVAECSRMNYKARFRPYELLDWQTMRWRQYGL
jgi:arginyl-tRNA--protein-N-Asp/Glu arginylyltransferase